MGNPYYKKQNQAQQGQQNNQMQGMDMQQNPIQQNNVPTVTQNPYIQQNPTIQSSTSFSTAEILTGALVGAAATYILTNENVQKTLFKGALSITDIISGGLDEMKERFEDAKAEHEAAKEA